MKYNKASFAGKIGKNAESKILSSGVQIITTSMYVDDSYKQQDGEWKNQGCWIELSKFIPSGKNGMADFYMNNLKKGMEVFVDCKIVDSAWEDKDGNKRNSNPKFQILDLTLTGKKEVQENNNNTANTKQEDEDPLPF